MKKVLAILFLFYANLCIAQSSGSFISSNPDSAMIVYKDVINFWKAYDVMHVSGKNAFEEFYIQPGSNGVKHFLDHNRIVNADTLYNTVQRQQKDYLSVRQNTLRIEEAIAQCRASYYAFKYLYPQARFPPLYFVIGRFNTGGVSLKDEQIIGTEMNATENIPFIVAHELIHANQQIPYKYKILLEQCIIEGRADFLGELISGRVASTDTYRYAKGKEAALKKDFLIDMHLGENDDFANWLYAGTRKDDRRADMGYYIGYSITKAYYDKATNKKKAVYEILHIKDCKDFLKKSGYLENK